MTSTGRPWRADWYPDPAGRFEFRYHNGAAWTADVSIAGVRYLDPVDGPRAGGGRPGAPGQPEHRDGLATAAMILGIAGICLSWAPLLFVVGVVAALLAIVFGVVARRRTPRDTRGFATVGIATGAGAFVLAAVGVWTSVLLLDAVDDYENPPPTVASITRCESGDDVLTVAGTLTNLGGRESDLRVVVRIPGPSFADRQVTFDLDDVGGGATVTFGGRFDLSDSFDPATPECRVVRVTGPLPFGFEVE